MKKLLPLFALVLLITSCTTTIPPYSGYLFLDYSPLTSSGIFVSESNSVNFEYTPLGSILVTARGGGKISHYGSPSDASAIGKFNSIDFKDVAELLKYELLRNGANGIINLKIVYLPKDNTQGSGYTITGMAIKHIK